MIKVLFIVSALSLIVLCGLMVPRHIPTQLTASPQAAFAQLAAQSEWHGYTSPDKTFSVELPCEPTRTNVSARDKPIYEYSCELTSTASMTFFVVMVLDNVDGAKIGDEAAFERRIKESFALNRKVLKMTPIVLKGGIGRDVVLANLKNEMELSRGRVILTGKHLYELGFVSTDMTMLNSPVAERFFSSFEPLK